MDLTISYANVWVDDHESAIDFYTRKLGFELREDVTVPEMGNFRWVAVGPPGGEGVSLVLMPIPGPPVFEPETQAQVRAIVAKGAAGGIFLSTPDCRATIEELRGRGVEIVQEPTEVPYGVDAGVRDPFGNHIRVVQPPAA